MTHKHDSFSVLRVSIAPEIKAIQLICIMVAMIPIPFQAQWAVQA